MVGLNGWSVLYDSFCSNPNTTTQQPMVRLCGERQTPTFHLRPSEEACFASNENTCVAGKWGQAESTGINLTKGFDVQAV